MLLASSSHCVRCPTPPPKLCWSFQNCRRTVSRTMNFDFNILPCSFYSVYPTIQVLLLSTLLILATAAAYRDPGFCINYPSRAAVCYHKDSFVISRALSPWLERIPSPFLYANRRLRLPPCVKFDLDLSRLMLLESDVSLNPGLVAPNLRPGAVNALSMRDKAPDRSDVVVSEGIDFLGITETWLTTRETSSDLAEMTPPPMVSPFSRPLELTKYGVELAFSSRMNLNSPQSTCLPNPVSNAYLANSNVVGLTSIFSIFIDYLVLPLLSLVCCRSYCFT